MQCSIAPHKMLAGSPLMVIYKKSFRRYATYRGRMAFKTKYPNCRHNFARIRPVASFRGLGGKYIFIGKGFHFCYMFETHFLNTTKFWEPHKRFGDNCPACPPRVWVSGQNRRQAESILLSVIKTLLPKKQT